MTSKELDIRASCMILDRVIKKKINGQPIGPFEDDWRNIPEIPTADEIIPTNTIQPNLNECWDDYQKEATYNGPALPHNHIYGPWPSTQDFLRFQYLALREDSIYALRNSVASFRAYPDMNEDKETYIYSKVHFTGLVLAVTGVAFRVTFSTERSGLKVRWKQSKRLQQGTLVAISTERDMFSSICKVAIVAARPLEGGLDQNPPAVDLFWGDEDQAVLDPAESYIMVEARSGYFEAYRHVLLGIQDVAMEKFSLKKHIVTLDNNIPAPAYLQENPFIDVTALFDNMGTEKLETLQNFNILEDSLLRMPSSTMDNSQLSACERILSKSLAIVQGPPGTGKTFTSVASLKALIAKSDSVIIVVAAQTNHALDQLLNHILEFEENILRLGGRCSKSNQKILHRTLHELRQSATDIPASQQGIKAARREVENQRMALKQILAPLLSGKILDEQTLIRYECITSAQADSLTEDGWVDAFGDTPVTTWLGESNLTNVPVTPPLNHGLPMEEEDLDLNQPEEGQGVEGDGEFYNKEDLLDILVGENVPILRWLTGKSNAYNANKCQKLLQTKSNLYDIAPHMRGSIYRFWEQKIDGVLMKKMREALKHYKSATETLRCTKALGNLKLAKHLGIKVVGCTTTGLSKYRGLISAMKPKILLVEEAAESLEANIVAAQYDSLEQLVLIGDHKQLRANVTNSSLEEAPYFFNISMFERLVNNGIAYTMLNHQRRMIPEVRKLLCIPPRPFYNNLNDHKSVLDPAIRPSIPGMGNRSLYFFHHQFPEARDASLSMYNQDEAEIIASFFNYLVLSGTSAEKITVLTFYNGQRKAIINELKKTLSFKKVFVNVFTVDSYQGEENDIVLLSMVRSNNFGSIGFLENQNRVAVALSRARRGLYIFGNAGCLMATEGTDNSLGNRSGLYRDILFHMRDQKMLDVDRGLPITCVKHGRELYIVEADQFLQTNGGCNQRCDRILLCGHPCPAFCHVFSHSELICPLPCPKILNCKHECSEICGNMCKCERCATKLTVDCGTTESQNALNIWDAEKADRNLVQLNYVQESTMTKNSQQTLVFNDTWWPTRINDDGVRSKAGNAIHTVLSRIDSSEARFAISTTDEEEYPALPAAPPMKTVSRNGTRPGSSKAHVLEGVGCTSRDSTESLTVLPKMVDLVNLNTSPYTSPTEHMRDANLLSTSSRETFTNSTIHSFEDLEGIKPTILPCFPDLEGLHIDAPLAYLDMDAFEATTQLVAEASPSNKSLGSQLLIDL